VFLTGRENEAAKRIKTARSISQFPRGDARKGKREERKDYKEKGEGSAQ